MVRVESCANDQGKDAKTCQARDLAKCQTAERSSVRPFCWNNLLIEGSLEVKLPTIWTDEKQRWKGSERRERLEERRVEEKESEERRCRCAKR